MCAYPADVRRPIEGNPVACDGRAQARDAGERVDVATQVDELRVPGTLHGGMGLRKAQAEIVRELRVRQRLIVTPKERDRPRRPA